jgi:hypothetical protein
VGRSEAELRLRRNAARESDVASRPSRMCGLVARALAYLNTSGSSVRRIGATLPLGGASVKLPNSAHTSREWRIHELTHDFRLEDVWALATPGGPDDFPRLVRQFASGERSQGGSSCAARTLWTIRWKLGELLGWDRADAGLPQGALRASADR